jgi:inosine-uridine nucleoside N-ribohydrolase
MRFWKAPLLALSLTFGGCAHMQDAQPSRNSTPPVVMDVDTGRDDAWSIFGALRNRNVALVVAGYGNTTRENAIQNSLDVMDIGLRQQYGDVIFLGLPVYGASDAPLAPATPAAAAEIARRATANGNGVANVDLPHSRAGIANYNSPNWAEDVKQAIIREGRPVDYIALGPMTNLSRVIDAFGNDENGQPLIRRYVRQVVMMGGSFEPGLAVDFNFKADPRAARHVLETFGTDVLMVPYDETKKMRLTTDEITALQPSDETGRYSREMMLAHARGWSTDGSILLHDPATLLTLTDTPYAERITQRVDIVQTGDNAGKVVLSEDGIAVSRLTIRQGCERTATYQILDRLLGFQPQSIPAPSPICAAR